MGQKLFYILIDVQQTRSAGGDPSKLFQLPDLWEGKNIHEVAEAVHADYPGALQVELIQWLWQEGAQLDYDVVPFRSSLDFVGLVIRLADLNTWAIGAVAPTNFQLKWHVGRPRPEEEAYKIAEGELTADDGVPQDIISKIDSMDLESATAFTAYNEGSPTHPSWPAMHSAASPASFWLAVVLDLNEDQYCEALHVDYAVSYARTVAGVHYPTDNIAGLNLGQQIMAEQLADHFERKYGSNRDEVQAKIDGLRFDWTNFNPETCSTGGGAVLRNGIDIAPESANSEPVRESQSRIVEWDRRTKKVRRETKHQQTLFSREQQHQSNTTVQ